MPLSLFSLPHSLFCLTTPYRTNTDFSEDRMAEAAQMVLERSCFELTVFQENRLREFALNSQAALRHARTYAERSKKWRAEDAKLQSQVLLHSFASSHLWSVPMLCED